MVEAPNIIPVNIEDEVSASYIDYAMSVIIGRALPDVRDGLKPVHRRILYAMYEQSNYYNRPYKKSARIVGDVIGKYHPHGDAAVYDALVRMAQEFNMRVPLVDGQGNFGSIDGDPPAAMRYTEVRMARAANELLADIEKETVAFGPNYDDNEKEPLVLPARIPNLLVNGSEGIAVGMATKIPPHNLTEVIDATIHLIHNPQASVLELMRFIPGPDFPTHGFICGTEGIREAYETGRGVIQVRARCEVVTHPRTEREAIVIHELPYQVNKARLLEKIAELVRDKRIGGISDLRDESDRRGMRVVIDLKKDAVGEVVLNHLYKMTPMQTSFGIILLAIVGGRPATLSLTEVLQHFLDFRRDVITRRTRFELRQGLAREHILLGYQIALDNLDAIIHLIRSSRTVEEAREGLMQGFALSQKQAQAILDLRLQRLTGMERDKILEELQAVQALIARLRAILADEQLLMELIVQELQEVKQLHGEPRRTEIVGQQVALTEEDLIADEAMVVTVTHTGYIKRTPLNIYRSQKRGGRGRTGMTTKEDDFIEFIFVASTHTEILVFTTFGRVFQLKVHELPLGSPATRGRPIVNLLGFDPEEGIACVLPIESTDVGEYIVMATEQGTIKRTLLDAYSNILSRGIIAIKLRDGDRLTHVRLCSDSDRILMVSRQGLSIQFEVRSVPPTGRDTMGVRGMRLDDEDKVVGMEVLRDTSLNILTVTENGFGKRTPVQDYPLQGRGGKGVITIKTSERNGLVVGARLVSDEDEIVMITNTGKVIRMAAGVIHVFGRNTQGVRLMRLESEEWVAGIALLAEKEDEDLEENQEDENLAEKEDEDLGENQEDEDLDPPGSNPETSEEENPENE
ncbi:MAG: DNA gyrase subunit A [Bradymonadales bacterium]|nr:DNA gyrase subunit A [Bradymonadales bacterium]